MLFTVILQLEMLLRLYVYMCTCIATYFGFIFCTARPTYCYVLQLEMHARLISAIKFHLLTYLLTWTA